MHYAVAVFKDEGTCYGVSVPDLPGIISAGDTMTEALFMAREGIELHIWGMQQDKEPIPEKLPLHQHRSNPEYEGAVFGVVPFEDPQYADDPLAPLVWDTTKTPYLIVLQEVSGRCYSVAVPDLPGCHANGDSVEGAVESGLRAIEDHLDRLLLDGSSIPEQRPFEEHRQNPDFANGLWAQVPVTVPSASPTDIKTTMRDALGG